MVSDPRNQLVREHESSAARSAVMSTRRLPLPRKINHTQQSRHNWPPGNARLHCSCSLLEQMQYVFGRGRASSSEGGGCPQRVFGKAHQACRQKRCWRTNRVGPFAVSAPHASLKTDNRAWRERKTKVRSIRESMSQSKQSLHIANNLRALVSAAYSAHGNFSPAGSAGTFDRALTVNVAPCGSRTTRCGIVDTPYCSASASRWS